MSTQPFSLGGSNLNPTGTGLFLPPPIVGGQSGQGTPTGSPGNFNFGNTANPNPPMPSSTSNPFSVPPAGPAPTTNPNNPVSGAPGGTFTPGAPIPGQNGFTTGGTATGVTAAPGRFNKSFGATGTELAGFLNQDAGYNSAITQQAIQAQDAAAQQQITLGEGNLKENLAASGISPNSSVAALELSNYQSNAQTQLNAINAQEYFNMWSQSMSQETSLLETMLGPNAQHQLATSPMAMFEGIAGGIGALAGGAGNVASGINI